MVSCLAFPLLHYPWLSFSMYFVATKTTTTVTMAKGTAVAKPKGTDDDFKTAACAGSLVKVAQKFVGASAGGKQLTKRFTIAK